MDKTRFDVIASSYELALAKYPKCRTDHFWLLQHANLTPSSYVLEVSGGTGFLTEKIAQIVTEGAMIVQDVAKPALEINESKCHLLRPITYMIEEDMTFPKLRDDTFDAIINLGGFHHIEDQVTFCKALYKKLKPGGVACIGDFEDNSSMQRYFDERIHYITDTGHEGLFASESRFVNLARFAGFDNFKVERLKVPFCFRNEKEIGEFFQLVHDLKQDPEETYQDIKKYFEIIVHPEGMMVMIDYVYACYQK